jgi:hypothetical protein
VSCHCVRPSSILSTYSRQFFLYLLNLAFIANTLNSFLISYFLILSSGVYHFTDHRNRISAGPFFLFSVIRLAQQRRDSLKLLTIYWPILSHIFWDICILCHLPIHLENSIDPVSEQFKMIGVSRFSELLHSYKNIVYPYVGPCNIHFILVYEDYCVTRHKYWINFTWSAQALGAKDVPSHNNLLTQ